MFSRIIYNHLLYYLTFKGELSRKSMALHKHYEQCQLLPPVCAVLMYCDVSFISPLGNPKKHIAALKKAVDTLCVGEPSLYNSLNLAIQTLK